MESPWRRSLRHQGLRVLTGIGSLACCEIRRNQRLTTSLLYAKEKLPKTAPESAYASAPSLKLHSTVMDHLLSSDGSIIKTRWRKSQMGFRPRRRFRPAA